MLFSSLGYIWIAFNAIEQDVIPLNDAFRWGAPGIIALGVSVLLINYLGKEEDR